jgi:hypothetical protein
MAAASFVCVVVALMVAGCSRKQEAPKPAVTAPAAAVTAPAEEPLPPAVDFAASLPEGVRAELNEPFKGDLDEMVKRRLVRVGAR